MTEQTNAPVVVDDDPFANVKTPSISFKDQPLGTEYRLRVTSTAKMVQSINFNTGKPDFWEPSDAEKAAGKTVGNPKMAAVLQGVVLDGPRQEEIGEVRSVWAGKPSDLFTKMAEAQAKFGRRIEPGGVLSIKHTDNEPASNKKWNDKKIYTVEYVGPEEKEIDDPLGMSEFQGTPAGSI